MQKNSCYIDLFDAWSLDFQLTVLVCFYDWYEAKQIDIWKKLFQYRNFWCMFLWWSKKYGSWVTSYQVNDGYWIISLSTLFLFVYWINTSVVYRVNRKWKRRPVKILSEKYILEKKNDPFRYRGQGSFFQVSFFIYSPDLLELMFFHSFLCTSWNWYHPYLWEMFVVENIMIWETISNSNVFCVWNSFEKLCTEN